MEFLSFDFWGLPASKFASLMFTMLQLHFEHKKLKIYGLIFIEIKENMKGPFWV